MLNQLPRWVADHPAEWGFVAAAGFFFIAGLLNGLYLVALIGAPLFGIGNWWLWRREGPAHRWRAALVERFPPKQR